MDWYAVGRQISLHGLRVHPRTVLMVCDIEPPHQSSPQWREMARGWRQSRHSWDLRRRLYRLGFRHGSQGQKRPTWPKVAATIGRRMSGALKTAYRFGYDTGQSYLYKDEDGEWVSCSGCMRTVSSDKASMLPGGRTALRDDNGKQFFVKGHIVCDQCMSMRRYREESGQSA